MSKSFDGRVGGGGNGCFELMSFDVSRLRLGEMGPTPRC